MPYIAPEVILEARRMDLLTYLQESLQAIMNRISTLPLRMKRKRCTWQTSWIRQTHQSHSMSGFRLNGKMICLLSDGMMSGKFSNADKGEWFDEKDSFGRN